MAHMTEDLSGSPVSESQVTAGQILREARTRQGLHLAMLSVWLKVPVRTLELLENDQFEALPGPTFVRALASSVCRQLRIDPAQVLERLPQRDDHLAAPPPALDTPVAMGHAGSRTQWRMDAPQWALLLLAVLMMGLIGALLWWPSNGTVSGTVQTTSESINGFMPPAAASNQEPAPASSPVGIESPAEPPAAIALSQAPASAESVPRGTSASPVMGPTMRLSAKDESWVEIRSADGQVVFSKVMRAGQIQDIMQPAPLNVVVGRAVAVEVQVNGRPFDLAPHTKITVARFEVLP
jgi:cytoskeleton protein RodZ